MAENQLLSLGPTFPVGIVQRFAFSNLRNSGGHETSWIQAQVNALLAILSLTISTALIVGHDHESPQQTPL